MYMFGGCVCISQDCIVHAWRGYVHAWRLCVHVWGLRVRIWWVLCGEEESHTPHQQCRFMSGPELESGHCNSVLLPLFPAPAPPRSQALLARDLSV